MADYTFSGAVAVSVAVVASMIYNPTGSAYDTDLSGYGIYDGLVISQDSMFMFENGQHDGGDSQASLTDTGATFPVDGYNTGFTLRNTSKATSGVIETADITDGTATNLVGTLSNSADWDDDNYYEVVVSDLAAGDRIYHDPQAVSGAFSYQLYDASDKSFSAVYELTITPQFSGAVSVNEKGIPSVLAVSGEIGGDVTVTVTPAATMVFAPSTPPPGEEIAGAVNIPITIRAAFEANIAAGDQNPGGWFWAEYEAQRLQKDRDKKRRAKAKKKAKKLQDAVDRALYLEERKVQEQEEREEELARLAELVESNRDVIMEIGSDRLNLAMEQALKKHTFSALEKLERTLDQERDLQAFHLIASQLLLNQ